MTNCRICGGEVFSLILELGHHPPSDAFLTKEQLKEPETHYPLTLVQCNKCSLVQINYVVDPKVLFEDDYPYVTGINKDGIRHFHEFAYDVMGYLDPEQDSFVVDIGGNDGTLLDGFVGHGVKNVLNVDPCGVESSVPTVRKFWDAQTAHFIKHCNGLADMIVATNVFAHCDDLHEFMKGVGVLLRDDGVFIVESPCLNDMVKYYQFDQIYHEHLSYFDEYPMNYLVGMHGMYLSTTEHNEMHGGSNRYFIKKLCGSSKSKQTKTFIPTIFTETKEACYCGGECECQGKHAA